tara:strand:+ start:102 stop:1487 length:1386 start_codon:yes stop_codon:yes gene_type:complete
MSVFSTHVLSQFAPAEPHVGGEAKVDIDAQMRKAYTVWSQKCRVNNIPTTPAYDVVGLLAVFHPEKFDTEGAVMKLKQEFRTVQGFIKDDYPTEIDFNLIIITDFGEECDDEVVSILAPQDPALLNLVFTDEEHFDEQVDKFESFGGSRVSVQHVSDLWSVFAANKRNVVLQIGPVHEKTHGKLDIPFWLPSFEYYLVGAMGSTLNSKGDAEENARLLQSRATDALIVDTDGGKGVFPFSYSQVRAALSERVTEDQLERICEHVIKIGWRNTVGRASPFAAKFIAHLVVKNAGANYATVKAVFNSCYDQDWKQECALLIARREGTEARARVLAEEYVQRMQTTAPDILDKNYEAVSDGTFRLKSAGEDVELERGSVQFMVPWTDLKPQALRLLVAADGSTNSLRKVRVDDIVEGYTYILVVLNILFDVPVEFFQSGQPGKWNPEWNHPGPLVAAHPFKKSI